MTKDTSGPAFPQYEWSEIAERFAASGGMTLRDYFAAKAMQSLISVWEPQGQDDCINDCAVDAYAYADAMLKARK